VAQGAPDVPSRGMHPIGGDHWGWSLTGSRSVEFCVWVLLHDGLRVRPFDIHTNGDERLRQLGMDAASWVRWFETVVNRDVEDQERLRAGGDFEPMLVYESDPPTIAEQLQMKEALRAHTPPALWTESAQVGDLLDGLWDDYSSRPVLRRNRHARWDREGEEPGTAQQHMELYSSLHELGSDLPSLHCYPVPYPALVVREVAPMALVLTSLRQWTWERYRDALLTGVASLAGETRP
jgi:hypothetical protein